MSYKRQQTPTIVIYGTIIQLCNLLNLRNAKEGKMDWSHLA